MPGKLGQSTASSSPNSKISKDILTQARNNQKTSREKVLEVLQATEEPLSIHSIANKAEVAWFTAKTALQELMFLGKVTCLGRDKERHGHPILFRLKRDGGE
jgi:predicted ArsR family transcriptional regulator